MFSRRNSRFNRRSIGGAAVVDSLAPTVLSVVTAANGLSTIWTFNENVTITGSQANSLFYNQFLVASVDAAAQIFPNTSASISGAVVTVVHPIAIHKDESFTYRYVLDGSASFNLRDAIGNYVAAISETALDTSPGPTDATVPAYTSLDIIESGTTYWLRLTSNEWLKTASVPANTTLTLAGTGATPLANFVSVYSNGNDQSFVEWELTGPEVYVGEVITASFTAGGTPIEDLSGNDLANFSGQAVTNNSTLEWSPSAESNLFLHCSLEAANCTFAASSNDGRLILATTANAGSLGGTMASGAGEPTWTAGKNATGRLGWNGLEDPLTSSASAPNFKFLHFDTSAAVAATIAFYHFGSIRAVRHIINTKTTAGTGVGIGATLIFNTDGSLSYNYANGSAAQAITSAAGVIVAYTLQTVVIVLSSTSANKVEIWVDGVLVASTAALSITPSTSNPGLTLGITAVGLLPPPVIWKSELSSAAQALARTWLLEQGASFDTFAQIATAAPPGLSACYTFGSGGPVVHTGPTPTAIGTPTYATDAGVGGAYVVTTDGSTDALNIDGAGDNSSGADKPGGMIAVIKCSASAAAQVIVSYAKDDDNGRINHVISATENVIMSRQDDAAGTATETTSNVINLAEYGVIGFSDLGTQAAALFKLTAESNYVQMPYGGCDVSTTTINNATLFATRPVGVFSAPLACSCAMVMCFAGHSPNFALMWVCVQTSKTQFGVA